MAIFEEKVKEPALSQEMQDILSRSMQDTDLGRIDDLWRYKYRIMRMLLANEDLLRTLHCAKIEEQGEELIGEAYKDVCIFDFMKLPDLKDEIKNYVCFEVSDQGYDGRRNKKITFRIVSHVEDHKTDWGISRQDLLSMIVKNIFDYTNELGGTLEPNSDSGHITNDGYIYREISYKALNPKDVYNKINKAGVR